MSRPIKDIKDRITDQLVYPRTHAKAVVMSSATTLEDAINRKANIDSIPTKVSDLANDLGYINNVDHKQDIISDLDDIRQNSTDGATAFQYMSGGGLEGTIQNTIYTGIAEINGIPLWVSMNSGQDQRNFTFKTINGESLIGNGDIVISGGNGAYPLVNHGTSDTTFTLTPNTFHVWDEVSSLTLTLGEETSGVANEYLFQFTSGIEGTTLSLPSDLKWANDSAPTIVPCMIYQVSILKGLASVLEFKNTIVFPIIGDTNGLSNEEYAKVYEYFVNTYNLTSTYDDPSQGVVITESLICDSSNLGGTVIKVSLVNTRLLLWTQKALEDIRVPSINNLGEYLDYTWD